MLRSAEARETFAPREQLLNATRRNGALAGQFALSLFRGDCHTGATCRAGSGHA